MNTTELRAQVLEYEHALSEVAACSKTCPDCKRIAAAALRGLSRGDFIELARWYEEEEA